MIPFAALLIVHGLNHEVPLFLASFAGFVAALPAVARLPRMRAIAMREARAEYAEYYFLFPLFISITLLTTAGFFEGMQAMLASGLASFGRAHVAFAQFLGSTFLSAILDNNIVADFASRALRDLDGDLPHVLDAAGMDARGGHRRRLAFAAVDPALAGLQRDIAAIGGGADDGPTHRRAECGRRQGRS